MSNLAGYNRKLSALLKRHELLGDEDLEKLRQRSTTENKSMAALLIGDNYIDEISLIGMISEDTGYPPIDLDKFSPDLEGMLQLNRGEPVISEADAKKYGVLPISLCGEYLTLAMANPYDVVLIDNLKLLMGRNILPAVSTERAIAKAIEQSYHEEEKKIDEFIQNIADDGEVMIQEKKEDEDDGVDPRDLLNETGEGSPAVKLVNMIIMTAVSKGASDIHIEPFEKRVRIRLRIDGVLHEVMNPPKRMEKAVVSRVKIMCDTMNIAETGKPQDGRFQVTVAGRRIDFRVNSLPTVHGEKICMRILDKGNLAGSLESLGFEPQVLDIIQRSIGAPYGMFLVTGPTGSGKSTTLYSCLQAVMGPEDNVTTVEEPVEYEIEGLNQVHVNTKRGLTFAAALRALLRQDPDTIMIGEIRDTETIEIAVKAALTGHLVLSTLHTNDAPSTINRIIDMGVEPFLVANTVLAISAQRLGRRLCKACKRPIPPERMPAREQLISVGYKEEEIEGLKLMEPVGCSLCSHGYKGRFAMVECLEITDPIREIILKGGTNIDIRRTGLKNGMVTLRRAGLMAASRGVTSVEEVMRHTTGEDS